MSQLKFVMDKNRFLLFLLSATAIMLLIFIARPMFKTNSSPPVETPSTELTLAEQLADCLPKSDMESKEKCDILIASINDYETCIAAGFPAMDSYPLQCQTPDGRTLIENVEEEAVFCTMDAMECPDGSFVGRVPPTCEFAPCPGN